MGFQKERRVLETLSKREQPLREFPRYLQLCPHDTKRPQSPQDGEELRSFPYLLAQFPRPCVHPFHFGVGIPFGGGQSQTQDGLQHELLLNALRVVRQGLKQLQSRADMMYRFPVSIPSGGVLSRLSQIVYCPLIVP